MRRAATVSQRDDRCHLFVHPTKRTAVPLQPTFGSPPRHRLTPPRLIIASFSLAPVGGGGTWVEVAARSRWNVSCMPPASPLIGPFPVCCAWFLSAVAEGVADIKEVSAEEARGGAASRLQLPAFELGFFFYWAGIQSSETLRLFVLFKNKKTKKT